MSTVKQVGELTAGDVFRFDALDVDVTVVSVEPTGSVKFGQAGPTATPIMRVVVVGMPKPFAGGLETAADHTVTLVEAVTPCASSTSS